MPADAKCSKSAGIS